MTARRFTFTSFIPELTDASGPIDHPLNGFNAADHPEIRFIIFQLERAPSSGRLHFQGYLELHQPSRATRLKTILGDPTVHVELAKGSAAHNIAYCSKEDTAVQPPQRYTWGESATQGQRNDIVEFVSSCKRGASDAELLDQHPSSFLRYQRGLAGVRAATATPRNPRKDPDVRVYWGPTGTGKSLRAHDELPAAYSKSPGSKWWDGYTNGQSVIIDDFRPEWWPIDYMLRLLDRYPLKVCV